MSSVDEIRLTVRSKGARELAHYLEEAIRSGRLGVGVRLPPERELSEEFGASRAPCAACSRISRNAGSFARQSAAARS